MHKKSKYRFDKYIFYIIFKSLLQIEVYNKTPPKIVI